MERENVAEPNAAGVSESLLAKVALYTDGFVIISDKDDQILWVNESMRQRTGYEMDELKGQRPGDIFRGPDTSKEIAEGIAGAYAEGEKYECEILNYTKDGEPFWLNLIINPVDGGEHYISVGKEITERKKREKALRESTQKAKRLAREKQDIISVLAHDIKSPLSSMLGSIDLLEEEELDDDGRLILKTMKQASRSMLNLVENMLQMSEIEDGSLALSPEPTDFREFVSGVIDPLKVQARRSDTELTFDFNSELAGTFMLDTVRHSQVINNLVNNAIKFSESGGTVQVILEEADSGPSHTTVRLEVHDQGRGIPADVQKSIFRKYEQGHGSIKDKYGGAGLGLTITKHIIEHMNGDIWLESEEGVGTTIYAEIPLEAADGES